MYWLGMKQTENGKLLAVGVRVVNGRYMEFAGLGHSIAEAKSRAMATMWRESRRSHGLPDEHVFPPPRVVRRPGAMPPK